MESLNSPLDPTSRASATHGTCDPPDSKNLRMPSSIPASNHQKAREGYLLDVRLGTVIHAVWGRLRVDHRLDGPWSPKSAVSGHSRRDTLRHSRCIVPKERKLFEFLPSSSPCNELLMLSSPISKATPYTILHQNIGFPFRLMVLRGHSQCKNL